VTRNGHRTYFKWHRGRRRISDPVFTGRRILEGMALGASVEVDLVVHGENGCAVLHDHLDISRETTGSGPAAALGAAQIRSLHLRDNEGKPIADRVMLLEDLCALLVATPPHPGALLQLDFKEKQGPFAPATIEAFARSVGPVAGNMILSSGEADTVQVLTEATPGLHVGYDPCHDGAIKRLRQSRDFAGFVADAIAASPRAEMIYLAYPLVLDAADAGFDIIAAFHAEQRRVDTYTLRDAGRSNHIAAERLLALKTDQITTDDPEGLAAALSP
jgi:glycerophosphoryl diester phosphodiesterase